MTETKKALEERLIRKPSPPTPRKDPSELEEGEIEDSESEPEEEPDDDLDLTDTKVKAVDEEAELMQQELDILLASPEKKRTMRMYADDLEDEILTKKSVNTVNRVFSLQCFNFTILTLKRVKRLQNFVNVYTVYNKRNATV